MTFAKELTKIKKVTDIRAIIAVLLAAMLTTSMFSPGLAFADDTLGQSQSVVDMASEPTDDNQLPATPNLDDPILDDSNPSYPNPDDPDPDSTTIDAPEDGDGGDPTDKTATNAVEDFTDPQDITEEPLLAAEVEQNTELIETLAVGDSFYSVTDEGAKILFSITSATTVQIGSGRMLLNPSNTDLRDLATTVDISSTGTISIPATVAHQGTTYTVTAIAAYAFSSVSSGGMYNSYRFSTIILPPSVTSIGNQAFQDHRYLGLLTFAQGSGLISIGTNAFQGAISLQEFTIPNTVSSLGSGMFRESGLQTINFEAPVRVAGIPNSMFASTPLKSITIPAEIKTIGDNAFDGCEALTSVEIPATVTSMGSRVFRNCSQLRQAGFADGSPIVQIPEGIFFGCVSLTDFQLATGVTQVLGSAFNGSGLTSIFIPNTTTYLAGSAFANCSYLASVEFESGNQTTAFSDRVFASCIRLESINLPSNLRNLGLYTFMNCRSLVQIDLPKLINTLGDFSFQGCTALSTVIFEGDASRVNVNYSTFYLCDALTSIVYLDKRAESLVTLQSSPDIYYTIAFYDDLAAVGSTAPLGLYSVKASSIPANATPDTVFQGQFIDAGNGFRWVYEPGFFIGDEILDSYYAYRFSNSGDLSIGDTFTAKTIEQTPVTYAVTALPNGLNNGTASVGTGLASAIAARTTGSVTLPQIVIGSDGQRYDVVSIASGAFKDSSSIAAVTVPASVQDIGANAFQRCTGLRRVFFEGDASQFVDLGMFAGCANIELVVFGGKKASLSFGVSNPAVYYTVRYYASLHDLQIANVLASLVVQERSILNTLTPGQVYSGSIPSLTPGFEWIFESGQSANTPLNDSQSVYAEGLGFRVNISVNNNGTISQEPCWFRMLSFDAATGSGTVQLGLGIDGVPALNQSARGVPLIPTSVDDANGNHYTVTQISDYAFGASNQILACPYITAINVPDSVVRVGSYAFAYCRNLVSLSFPASLLELGKGVASRCQALRDVQFDLSCGLKLIPAYAFDHDEQLLSFDFPTRVERIGEYAFNWCFNLSSLRLPASLRYVDAAAFSLDYRIRDITFLGDASRLSIGPGAFNITDDPGNPSRLTSVYFTGKRLPNFPDYAPNGTASGMPTNEYRRNWYQYFNVSLYASKADYLAGRLQSSFFVREDVTPISVIPAAGAGRTWAAESGFAMDAKARDSFSAYISADIGQATISGINAEYNYTGDYIKPSPVLTMPDGTVLRMGTDYDFDRSLGLNSDGYINNRRQGSASVNLIGKGEFAGAISKSFNIVAEIDASTSMEVKLKGQLAFVYTGAPIQPNVEVTVTIRGEQRLGVLGTDYTVSYLNNVDADQKRNGTHAAVVVKGTGMFSGTVSQEFSISPYSIKRCETESSVTVYPNGKLDNPKVTVTNTLLGKPLAEGEDFVTHLRPSLPLTRDSTMFIIGTGNYTDSLVVGFNASSGSNGGAGGGDGTGIGSGFGFGSGGGDAALGIGLGGGGGNGGDRPLYTINEILFDEVPLSSSPSDLLAQTLLFIVCLLALAVFIAGVVWRTRNYIQARGRHGRRTSSQ